MMPADASTRPVVVVEYDEAWPRLFENLRAHVWPAVGDVALAVEHVGSTSVPGLCAKPIIDMTVIVAARHLVPQAIERLGLIGYRHRGNLGIDDREAFEWPQDLARHHLYVCPAGTTSLRNQLTLRDYLRAHPDVAVEYGALKKALARQFPREIDSYVAGKTDFIVSMLRRAGLDDEMLESIERSNRKRT